MGQEHNINPRQRRSKEQIAADRQAIVDHVSSSGGSNVRPPEGASRVDIAALEAAGQLRRTVRREFDVVYSPNFNNGQNVSALRHRVYLHLPEEVSPATEIDISPKSHLPGSAGWVQHHYKTANDLYRNMQATRDFADQVDYLEAPELHEAADEAEEAYDNQFAFMNDFPDLHGALNKHLDAAHKGYLY